MVTFFLIVPKIKMATTSVYWTKSCYMLVLRWMVFHFHGRNLIATQVHEHVDSLIIHTSICLLRPQHQVLGWRRRFSGVSEMMKPKLRSETKWGAEKQRQCSCGSVLHGWLKSLISTAYPSSQQVLGSNLGPIQAAEGGRAGQCGPMRSNT